jgi:hypothetical protein
MGDRRAGFTIVKIIRSVVPVSRESCQGVTREGNWWKFFSSCLYESLIFTSFYVDILT